MKKVIVVLLIILILMGIAHVWQRLTVTAEMDFEFEEGMALVLEWTEPYYCSMVSENVGVCDIPAYINMLSVLVQEGYSIEEYMNGEGVYDYILSKDDQDKFRLHYGGDGRVTSIAFCYEDSARPFTYIIEGGEHEPPYKGE